MACNLHCKCRVVSCANTYARILDKIYIRPVFSKNLNIGVRFVIAGAYHIRVPYRFASKIKLKVPVSTRFGCILWNQSPAISLYKIFDREKLGSWSRMFFFSNGLR